MDKFSVLQQYFGHSSFRPGQEQVVDAIVFPARMSSALCPPAQANLFVTRFRPC